MTNIRNDYSNYGKLELIAKQISFLQNEAVNIYNNHELNSDINKIECNFKKVPGSYYYIYEKNNNKILSMISPEEGIIYDKFISKVYFDYDNLFYTV